MHGCMDGYGLDVYGCICVCGCMYLYGCMAVHGCIWHPCIYAFIDIMVYIMVYIWVHMGGWMCMDVCDGYPCPSMQAVLHAANSFLSPSIRL